MKNKLLAIVPYLFILAVAFAIVFPLFHSGFFPMHDDTQVARVFEMGKSLSDGMMPVRWVTDLGYGYGYPIFNFYAPFAYYVGGLITLLFHNSLFATKVMIGLGALLSAVSMYMLAKSLWGKAGGMLAATLYAYAPYHAVDIYVRGDIAEMWAYAFFPLALYGVWQVYKNPTWKNMVWGVIGFAGVIVSHNLSALLFSPFLLISVAAVTALGVKQKTKAAIFAPLILVFGLLCSMWYVLPVFAEFYYTNVLSQVGGGADFHNHYVCFSQLWQSQWGYGGSAPGCVDGLSFMIGKLQIIIAVVSLFCTAFFWKKSKEHLHVYLLCLTFLLLSIFLMLPLSQFVWDGIKPLAFLQYPWRYLLMASLFISLLGGGVGWVAVLLHKKIGMIGIIVLCLFIAVFSKKYFVPQIYIPTDSEYYTNTKMLTWTTSKVSDEYMPKTFSKPTKENQVPQQLIFSPLQLKFTMLYNKTDEKKFSVYLPKPTTVNIAVAYFPSWHIFIDGKEEKLAEIRNGMQVFVPEGKHTIDLVFRQSLAEQLGNGISLASIVTLLIGIIYTQKKKRT